MIEVVKPGFTTVQGGPVRGRAHRGWSLGGAADLRALAFANAALGNARDAPALECVLTGPTLKALVDVELCVAGAPYPVEMWRPFVLAAGATLPIGTCVAGLRAVVAVAGGLDRADVGAAIARGTTLGVGMAQPTRAAGPASPASDYAQLDDVTLRVTDGPQRHRFGADALDAVFTVGRDSDRRGVRLEGRVDGGGEIVTEGSCLGAVQVPASGQPIILGVDQCTTGGYAKIANVISADVWLVGQLRPGARVRFARVSIEEARAIHLAQRGSG